MFYVGRSISKIQRNKYLQYLKIYKKQFNFFKFFLRDCKSETRDKFSKFLLTKFGVKI